jgi:diguanylate cyclase (GGDEF)-like protein
MTKDRRIVACPLEGETCPLQDELDRLRKECQRLSGLVERDALTGLHNYDYLLKAVGREMERSRRTGIPTGLIMIDLDHFKSVNDVYGHETGNRALRHVSAVWAGQTRQIDIVCRYGGEEFAIILPGTRLHRAIRTAERLRQVLETSPLDMNGRRIELTASFGVDVFRHRDPHTPEQLIEQVDRFLLEAKSGGRNRVCHPELAGEEMRTALGPDERKALFGQDGED